MPEPRFRRVDSWSVAVNGAENRLRLPFPPEFGHWLLAGTFHHADIREHANFGTLAAALQFHCGRSCFKMFSIFREGSAVDAAEPLISFVAIDPDNARAIACAGDLMDLHDDGENMSDEAFWQVADVHVQRYWAALPMSDRLQMVLDSGVPPAVAVQETVPANDPDYSDLWTELYQQIGL